MTCSGPISFQPGTPSGKRVMTWPLVNGAGMAGSEVGPSTLLRAGAVAAGVAAVVAVAASGASAADARCGTRVSAKRAKSGVSFMMGGAFFNRKFGPGGNPWH